MTAFSALGSPCDICRRRMDWLESDDDGRMLCRGCLDYLNRVARDAPRYRLRLLSLAELYARCRGERGRLGGVA